MTTQLPICISLEKKRKEESNYYIHYLFYIHNSLVKFINNSFKFQTYIFVIKH